MLNVAPVEVMRSVIVPYTPAQMYALVEDCERYPEFLAWVQQITVVERSPSAVLARMRVRVAGLEVQLTTRNHLHSPERIELQLVDGPFRDFHGHWLFTPIGDVGAEVAFRLRFELAGSMIRAAIRVGFERIAQRLAADFAKRAQALHG